MKIYVKCANTSKPIHYVRIREDENGKPEYTVYFKQNGVRDYKERAFITYSWKSVPKKVLDFLDRAKYYDKYRSYYLPEDIIEDNGFGDN